MTSYNVVIRSWLPNGGHLRSAALGFLIFPKLRESTKIEQKVTKTGTGTLIWAKDIKYGKKIFKEIFLKKSWSFRAFAQILKKLFRFKVTVNKKPPPPPPQSVWSLNEISTVRIQWSMKDLISLSLPHVSFPYVLNNGLCCLNERERT